MALVNGTLGRPIQGISQQPNNNRVDGQCTASVNMIPDVVRGLTNRVGGYETAKLPIKLTKDDVIHFYRRDAEEAYFIVIPKNRVDGIKIFSFDGTNHNLKVENDAANYLYQDNVDVRSLKFKTIGDFTFVVNPKVTVREREQKTSPLPHNGGVYCQFMDYAQTQTIYCNDVQVATYKSADGSHPSHKETVATSKVIAEMAKQINAGVGAAQTVDVAVQVIGGAYGGIYGYQLNMPVDFSTIVKVVKKDGLVVGFDSVSGRTITFNGAGHPLSAGETVTVHYMPTATSSGTDYVASVEEGSNVLWISRRDGADFTLRTTDDADGGNLIAVKGAIEDVSKLPAHAPVGFKVKIAPKGSTNVEQYWLAATQGTKGFGITWKETVAPDTSLGLDNGSMPITFIRESVSAGVATFTLKYAQWGERQVGDLETNTNPSFVGGTINSLGVFQNRLYFTSGEAISMTRSSEFFDFFKQTTQTVLKTDPYDVYSDSDEVSVLKESLSFNGDLIFFADKSQHSMSGAKVVSPSEPAPISKLTAFDAQLTVPPVSGGENIFFAFDYGRYTGIREFFTDSVTDTKRARPVTDHVNQLIQGRLREMKCSTALNLLVCQGSDLSTLYTYNFMWQGTDKVQSAWGVWKFDEHDEILFYAFDEATMYILMLSRGYLTVKTFDLGDPPEGYGLDFPIRLDNKYVVTATRQPNEMWKFRNPLQGYPDSDLVCIAAEGFYAEDIGSQVSYTNGYDITFPTANMIPAGTNEVKLVVGTRIRALYMPSLPFPRDNDGSPRSDYDRLQVGQMLINYDSAGPCRAKVRYSHGKEYHYNLTPRILDHFGNIVGFERPSSGLFTVPVRSKSNRYDLTLTTDSHIPLEVREFEYQGTYSPRGRNM